MYLQLSIQKRWYPLSEELELTAVAPVIMRTKEERLQTTTKMANYAHGYDSEHRNSCTTTGYNSEDGDLPVVFPKEK